MRKILLAAALVLTTVAPSLPAQATHRPGAVHYAYTVDLPCLVVCSYWIDNGFTPCTDPFPPGSYEDKVTPPAPTAPAGKIGLLTFDIFPRLDWDSFICANTGSREELASGAIAAGEPCDGILGPNDPTGTACAEDSTIPTAPGRTYILRAYNWQDGPIDCPAAYTFFAL